MVNLYYASDEMEKLHHRWPFVYLHGEAEDMNLPVFAANEGAPPDICVADIPLDEAFKPTTVGETKELECTVNGLKAVAVLHNKDNGAFGSYIQGRVSLVSDPKALEHARDVASWR